MKKTVIVMMLALAFGANAFADETAELRARIDQKIAALAELREASRTAAVSGGKATLRLTYDSARTLIVGAGTLWLADAHFENKGPLRAAINWVDSMDPKKSGKIFGEWPRTAIRGVGQVLSRGYTFGVLAGGTLWAAVEAFYTASDAFYIVIDNGTAAVFEAQVQLAQEQLTYAAEALAALERSK